MFDELAAFRQPIGAYPLGSDLNLPRPGELVRSFPLMIATPSPTEQLDHYRIDALVSRSGMATIFRGTDLRNGQPVAIKIPHPELECDPLFFDRFHREAELGRKFDHAGVVKVLPQFDPSRV